MSEDFDAIVIGAGAVGLSIARALSKSKKKVLVMYMILKEQQYSQECTVDQTQIIKKDIEKL